MKKLFWIMGAVMAFGLAGAAQAQYGGDSEITTNWELRAGVFAPESGGAKTKGSTWMTVGGEKMFYLKDRIRGTVSVDYYGAEGIYNIPVCLNLRADTRKVRCGGGLGLSFGQQADGGRNGLCYNLLLGYNLTEGTHPILFDIRYLGNINGGKDLQGWAFTLGYLF